MEEEDKRRSRMSEKRKSQMSEKRKSKDEIFAEKASNLEVDIKLEPLNKRELNAKDDKRKSTLSVASKTNRFSQIFNYEEDFEVILAEDKKQKAFAFHSVNPTKDSIDIALKKIRETGKLKDVTEIHKEKKTKIPSLKELLEEHIPGVTDFFTYFFTLISLVFAAILYTVFDLVIYNEFFKDSQNSQAAYYATSVNMIGVCFDFLWKYANCVRVYPDAIKQKKWIVFWGAMGCSVHILTLLAIRYPIYNSLSQEECPSDGIFITGMVLYLAITYTLDFFILPIVFRRLDPAGKNLIKNKVIAGEIETPMVFIGMSTLIWILLWFIFVVVSVITRFDGFQFAMEVVLWVPMVVSLILVFLDGPKFLLNNVQHLIFYLWFLYIMPQMTSSLLSAFVNLENGSLKFILSLIFIAIMQFYISTVSQSSGNMGDGGPNVHFLFQVQFFEYFFGALFFIDVELSLLFWLILFAQSFWLIFRNSGLGIDLFVWSYNKFIKEMLEPFGLLQNITFESARQRLYAQSRKAVQYTICDLCVLIAIPMQYLIQTSYMTPEEKREYSQYYRLPIDQENYEYALYYRFLSVALVKALFHACAHLLLWYKVRNYNEQSKIYSIPEISFIGLFSEYIKKYWFYFYVIIIFSMKASYIALSIILSTKTFASNSLVSSVEDRKLFWLTDLYVFVGYRFSTSNTYCIYPSPPS